MPAAAINANLQPILAELHRGLEAIYGDRLIRLVLFGSQARGDAKPDSDIDVLVVLQGPVDSGEEISRCSEFKAALCLTHGIVISSVYVSEDQYRNEQSPLLLNVRREGVPV